MTKDRALHELCRDIQDGYAAGKSGLDEQMLGLLVELGDRAEAIGRLLAAATEVETVMRQLQDLPDQARSIIAQGYFAAAMENVRAALAAARANADGDAPMAAVATPGVQRVAELARYVSGDDVGLPHREFLRLVADRIHEDVAREADGAAEAGPVPHTEADRQRLADAPQVAATGNPMIDKPGSWVLRNKHTGEVVMETFDPAMVAGLNTAKYEAVPVAQYLGEFNRVCRERGAEAANAWATGMDPNFKSRDEATPGRERSRG